MTQNKPICVDLDGTLVLTDTMWEAFFGALKKHPLLAFQMLWWLKRGRGYGKYKIAERASLVVESLPYNQACIDWIKVEKAAGKNIFLVTGSNEKFANMVAEHVGLFDGVIGSTHERTMSGHDKASALTQQFGESGFDYAGNSAADLPVWKVASRIIVVNAPPAVIRAAKNLGSIITIGELRLSLQTMFRAIRWHQWAKNILIFVPVLTAHELLNVPAMWAALLGFISFSAIASAVYLMNDLVDLPADRQNHYKKHRPLASGKIPILTALKLGVGLALTSVVIAAYLSPLFLLVICMYITVNIGYSFRFKKIPILDVLIIASLYVLRIFAGGAATGITTSPWLLIFAAFVFLSLALVKRVSEVLNLSTTNKTRAAGRGYTPTHRGALMTSGIIASIVSLIVLVFYINSLTVQTLYQTPLLLWLLVPLFGIWLTRVWRITKAGNMHEDPTVFAAKDPISYATAIAGIIIVILAT